MPDPDLQEAEAVTDDFSDLVYEEESPVPAPEEQVEEEATEPSEEPEGQAEAPKGTNDVPDLSLFPEDIREQVKRYTDVHVGRLQKTWQEKLEEAADVRKKVDALTEKAAYVDQFNERVEKDPAGVIRDLQEILKQKGVTHPEDPGPPPDLLEDPGAFQKWVVERDTYREWQYESKLAAQKAAYEEQLSPIQALHQKAQREQALSGIKQSIGADDDEWNEIVRMESELSKDNLAAIRAMHELVRLRKGATKKTDRVKEALKGTEERAGLPRTGSRAKPTPTGNAMKDALAELQAEGIEYPDE